MNPRRIWPADADIWKSEFSKWLQNAEGTDGAVWQLARWLEGLDLPAIGPDTPAYLILLRGLPRGAERAGHSRRMADLAAQLVNSVSGQSELTNVFSDMPGPDDPAANELLYNLLCFCGGLAQPDVLADSLDGLLQRRDLRGRFWSGYDLSAALRLALVWNQPDGRWIESVWKPMLEGDASCKVHGGRIDAADGIRKITPLGSSLKRLEPRTSAGEAEWDRYYETVDLLIEPSQTDNVFIAMQESGCSEMALRWANLDVEHLITSAYEVTPEEVMQLTLQSCEDVKARPGTRSRKFLQGACSTLAYAAWTLKAEARDSPELKQLIGLQEPPIRLTRS